MIKIYTAYDEWNNGDFEACSLIKEWEKWMFENQDKFELLLNKEDDNDFDLPF